MFRLYAFTVDALAKVRQVINRVIVGREQDSYYPTKNSSFDVLSLANQLHRSRSTTLEGPEQGKVYFSLNSMPDLFAEGVQALFPNVKAYNLSLEKTEVLSTEISYNPGSSFENPMDLDADSNKVVNELFSVAREASSITFNLANVNLWSIKLADAIWRSPDRGARMRVAGLRRRRQLSGHRVIV